MIAPLRRLARDTRGAILVEFAFVMPVALTLFLGGYELSDASACKRRTAVVARAAADLTSQYDTITESQMATILAASTQIMAPYDMGPAKVRISQVTVDSTLTPKIAWSRARNVDAWATGTVINLPLAQRIANTSYIYSEVSYTYQSNVYSIVGARTFTQVLFMFPRKSTSVTLKS